MEVLGETSQIQIQPRTGFVFSSSAAQKAKDRANVLFARWVGRLQVMKRADWAVIQGRCRDAEWLKSKSAPD